MGHVTGLSRTGLKDWFIQRVSAIVIVVYAALLLALFLSLTGSNPSVAYQVWTGIFASVWIKIFTIITFVAIWLHAWVGFWTILTDYVHCKWLAGLFQITFIVAYLACLIWLCFILAGVSA